MRLTHWINDGHYKLTTYFIRAIAVVTINCHCAVVLFCGKYCSHKLSFSLEHSSLCYLLNLCWCFFFSLYAFSPLSNNTFEGITFRDLSVQPQVGNRTAHACACMCMLTVYVMSQSYN